MPKETYQVMLYRGAASEPGHLLACMVELKGKVASLQCGQFLSQVNLDFFANIFPFCNIYYCDRWRRLCSPIGD